MFFLLGTFTGVSNNPYIFQSNSLRWKLNPLAMLSMTISMLEIGIWPLCIIMKILKRNVIRQWSWSYGSLAPMVTKEIDIYVAP